MNDLSVDIGYKSINHYGEYLCGDHVDVVQQENNDSKVVVLADGLKSGVKASILSTLTAKIISTMMLMLVPGGVREYHRRHPSHQLGRTGWLFHLHHHAHYRE